MLCQFVFQDDIFKWDEAISRLGNYYKRIRSVYGVDYDPIESGCIILLERNDPLTDPIFLEEKLSIRGGQDLASIIKEFVDYDTDSNLFDVLVIFSADYALSYLIPNEAWVGEKLLNQLQTFKNYSGNNSD
ncbi:MAG: hypothetical protein P4L59_18695 [Desulfosporosinus sp.]|nr:hypothetical protein [Desulfosporosinus sp.]